VTYSFIKRTAIFTMMAYIFMVFPANYSFANELKSEDLKSARKFYDEGDHGAALRAIEAFFSSVTFKEDMKDDFCFAYFLQAKIYFEAGNIDEMTKALTNLYKINPKFQMPPGEYKSFKEDAKKIQDAALKKFTETIPATSHGVIIPPPSSIKKKKFPVLLVVGAVVVVGVLAYLLTKKKPEKTLTVTVGEGVDGNPANGTHKYKQGSSANYSYTLKNGYTSLIVKLDGADGPASGTITMDKDHILTVNASKIAYTLTVSKGVGVNGAPDSNVFYYNDGVLVNYNYTLQTGYQNLVIMLDGISAPTSGTITMNGNHTLSASAVQITGFTLTVTRGPGVNGDPNTGTYSYGQGAAVSYNYSLLDTTYKNLDVTLDGVVAPASGTITMNGNHTLSASATKVYQLTVSLGEGVSGTPGQGSHSYNEGATVPYNYSLKTGYKDLTVTIDGVAAPASGTITMSGNHTISASAVKNQYKLTVIKDDHLNGIPLSGTYFYNDGAKVSYSYKIAGTAGTVVVILDSNVVSQEGSVTMDKDHTLNATWQPPGSGDYKYTNAAAEPVSTPGKSIKEGK